ncbi:RagB/SusD family nutrient uptake outer membrane protein [Prevotella sp. 10(H)]|uniref:RagB/SusD family nutrient uptake outer membrane protein n=1 Tax=Prevotella sp. 10(H) TaxID=1158294 RepID=UPI0004A6C0EB|nr:RagB/SusD family nutrient uptake outer membrane protein [Prevotella sp. 10(H)]
MKKALHLSLAAFFFLFLTIACSDDDDNNPPPPSAGQKQVEEIVKELEKITDVSNFTDALKRITPDLDFDENKLTVLAVKNPEPKKATENTSGFSNETLKRHIVKGVQDFSQLGSDTLILKSISDDILYATKLNGEILINGIPLASASPTKVGDSYIYIITATVPEIKDIPVKKYKITFNIQECNEEWSIENNKESSPSEGAYVVFYKNTNGIYTAIDSIKSDNKGVAVYHHNEADGVTYMVKKGEKRALYYDYLVKGVFTTQAEIDTYPQYQTGTSLDYTKPGTLKLADLDGDGIINAGDKMLSEYLYAESNSQEDVFIVTPGDLFAEEIIKLEDIPQIKIQLNSLFTSFISYNYTMDRKLIKPEVTYPSLPELSNDNIIWGTGYNFINRIHAIYEILNRPNSPANVKTEWEKTAGEHWAQYAHVYTTLASYFGNIILVTEVVKPEQVGNLRQNTRKEVIQYIESLIPQVSQPYADAVKALTARLWANEREFAKAANLSKEIITKGDYALVADNKPLDTPSNKEVLLGGYTPENIDLKGKYAHPVRYREVLLTYAESVLESGNIQEALQYANQILAVNGKPMLNASMTKEQLRDAIQDIWIDELNEEGITYMLINRWGKLLYFLGDKGARDYNNLLPIPFDEINSNPNFKQNPGY